MNFLMLPDFSKYLTLSSFLVPLPCSTSVSFPASAYSSILSPLTMSASFPVFFSSNPSQNPKILFSPVSHLVSKSSKCSSKSPSKLVDNIKLELYPSSRGGATDIRAKCNPVTLLKGISGCSPFWELITFESSSFDSSAFESSSFESLGLGLISCKYSRSSSVAPGRKLTCTLRVF